MEDRNMGIIKAMETKRASYTLNNRAISHQSYQATEEAIRREKEEIEPHFVGSGEDKIILEED
jgi:hypothetical protein